MIIIKNQIIPRKGYVAITIWPFIFCRHEMDESDITHELIHGEQQKEMLIIFFYLTYLLEAIFKGYDNISFEIEAYKNQDNPGYIKTRNRFAMWRKQAY